MLSITVAFEFNYGNPGEALGQSVWSNNGDWSVDIDTNDAFQFDAANGWVLVIGRVYVALAESVITAIAGFLRSTGIVVVERGLAD